MQETIIKTENRKPVLNPDLKNTDLETELENYTKSAVRDIQFSVIIKPALISFVALIFSFFLDVSRVPILGNVTIDLAKSLFPGWQPATEAFEPYTFWWLPVVIYALFIFLAYLTYTKLKVEIIRTPASETIDRIVTSYTSVIDGIATALPLIGAAILLVSISLGEEIFLGLSVPFEVKALIVLALGKLFEPVLDQLSVEFQNVVNHVQDIRDKYFSRIQVESSRSLMRQLNQGFGSGGSMSADDMEKYKSMVEHSAKLSEVMQRNFASMNELADRINSMENISSEKIQQLTQLAGSISAASQSLTDERTITGLKHLEAIVKK